MSSLETSYLISGSFEHRVKVSPGEPEHRWSSVRAGERIFCIPYLLNQTLALFQGTYGTRLYCTTARDDTDDPFTGVY